VGDPDRLQPAERVGNRFRPGPLPRVHDGGQTESPCKCINAYVVARRRGGFVPAEAEADDARPGLSPMKLENPVGGARPPLPDGVQENADRAAAAPLVFSEDALEGVADGIPRKPDPLDDGGRDVDLGVTDPLAMEPAGEVAGDGGVVVGARQAAADVTVEAEKAAKVGGAGVAEAERSKVGENGPRLTCGEADQGRRRDGAFEVQVEFDFRSGPEAGEKGAKGGWGEHDRPSYGAFPPGVLPPGRLWIRGAAFGVDLLLLAGTPLLLSTLAIVAVLLYVPDPPVSLARGFVAAQGVFALLFLFRDTGGGSPGKRLFGLRLVREGGRPVGLLASMGRNVPMLVPGWNLIELFAVIRRRDGRRGGDRLAGTTLLES
jgi:uncharacterized RDD family membrane protein YckC